MAKLFGLASRLAHFFNWLPGLATRISIGVMFIGTGWGKLHHIDKVISFFTDLGLPAPAFQAHLVGYTELVCGVLITVGLFTRLAAIPPSVIMVVALFTAKKAEIGNFDDLVGANEYLYLLLLVWLVIFGAGAIAIDRFIAPRWARKN